MLALTRELDQQRIDIFLPAAFPPRALAHQNTLGLSPRQFENVI